MQSSTTAKYYFNFSQNKFANVKIVSDSAVTRDTLHSKNIPKMKLKKIHANHELLLNYNERDILV